MFRTSERTVLTYCSHEVLLKNLMLTDEPGIFNLVTHIVLVSAYLIIMVDLAVYYRRILRMRFKCATSTAISY
jgi:hypothetical protein